LAGAQNLNKINLLKLPLLLASKSPRRKILLEQIGLEFKVSPSQIAEDFSINLSPIKFTEHWAKKKAREIAKLNSDSLVIGADTIVVIDHKILGKPKNKKDSFQMLKKLSGRTHKVITSIHFSCIKYHIERTINEETEVSFIEISEKDIFFYIDNYNPYDKAGSYGIQDWFSVQVEKINGCYYNVMGFPVSAFYKEYRKIKQELEIL